MLKICTAQVIQEVQEFSGGLDQVATNYVNLLYIYPEVFIAPCVLGNREQ